MPSGSSTMKRVSLRVKLSPTSPTRQRRDPSKISYIGTDQRGFFPASTRSSAAAACSQRPGSMAGAASTAWPLNMRTRSAIRTLIINLGFDQFRQQNQGFLPAQIASLGWDRRRNAFLDDVQLCPYQDLFERDRALHL